MKRRQLILFGGTVLSAGLLQRGALGQNGRSVVALLKQVTLKVMTPGPSGSGVLVRKSGNTYFFLTANHVLSNASAGEEVYVQTSDGKEHRVDIASAQRDSLVDLALASFQASDRYTVPELGNSGVLQELDTIYVAGFPLETIAVPNPTITITDGKISSIGAQTDGYGLGYTANTQPGMSGGPVLNQAGQLVGIHGRADGEQVGEVRVKTGLNWALPISTAVSTFSLQALQVSTSKVSNPEPRQQPSDPQNFSDTFSFEVVKVNDRGEIINRQTKSARYRREDLGNGVTLDMVSIPAGKFVMGSPESELKRDENEGPQRQISVPAFYMGKYVVTQAQWQEIMGNNPSRYKGSDHPVETVSWNEAQEFCQKLSQRTKQNYRLPSEAEWEYACRSGTMTPFSFGSTITTELVNCTGVPPYRSSQGWKSEFRKQTVDVGSLLPNNFGLYEMHGNVREFCADHWYDNYQEAPIDGSPRLGNGKARALRGGSWISLPDACRSAHRGGVTLNLHSREIGFRLELSLPEIS